MPRSAKAILEKHAQRLSAKPDDATSAAEPNALPIQRNLHDAPGLVSLLESDEPAFSSEAVCTPALYDIGSRDVRGIMDVAVYRLSKVKKLENSVIEYNLPDGKVTVSSGQYGMASVWDYDLVLMAISNLTEQMNRYREGKGPKPAQTFQPTPSEILKFTRKGRGGKQKNGIEDALKRLATTHVSISRLVKLKGETYIQNEGETLIGPHSSLRNARTKEIESFQFKVADWIYKEITEGKHPDVLSIHPDYFDIENGLGRFVYRLARRTAGRTAANWGFRLLYERSGSTGEFKEFCRMLREVIAADNLPEYTFSEIAGRKGPVLAIRHRDMKGRIKAQTAEEEAETQPLLEKSE